MTLSIRTKLTLLIAAVFLCVLIFLTIAGAIGLYVGLNIEIDKSLAIEEDRLTELFEDEFIYLIGATGVTKDTLTEDLLDELNELYGYKQQYALFVLDLEEGQQTFEGGGISDVHLLLPENFLTREEGNYNQNYNGLHYRILTSKNDWGTLVLIMENRTYYDVVDQLKGILVVGIPITLILVLIGGRFLARLTMKPVVSIAEKAEKVTLTNFEQQLFEYKGKDEFGKLVVTLNRMIVRIEEGVKQIRQFTQDAAHELRTPLTILRGELELLYQNEKLNESNQGLLQKVVDRTIILSKIVDNLMLLAQSDSNGYPIEKKQFSLNNVLKDVVEDTEVLLENRKIKVTLQKSEPVTFHGDEQLIRRLLLNLSENAIKNTAQGEIEFCLESNENEITLSIKDTGTGIPQEELPLIFNRFYRIDKALSTVEGSGLGLAICKWIVTAHAGEIKIESEMGKGTAVTISLPNYS